MRWLIAPLLAVLLLGCVADDQEMASAVMPAQAELPPTCMDLGTMLGTLASQFGEVPVWSGITNKGTLETLTLRHDPHYPTWTLIETDETGRACVAASGTKWNVTMPEGEAA